MPFFTWNSTLSVGVQEMDAQHQKLIELINRLHSYMQAGKGAQEISSILEEMIQYTQYHFAAEEELLKKHQYPALTTQKLEHAAFVRKTQAYQAQANEKKIGVSIEVLNFLREWLTKHIQVEDKKYTAYLNGKGVA